MAMKRSDLVPVVVFTVFVFWLLTTVMNGPLLSAIGMPRATSYFLPVHIPFLLGIGFFCSRARFDRLAPVNCIVCAAMTLVLPWVAVSAARYLLMCMGASGAFVTIYACVSLRRSRAPLLCAAAGLVLANLMLISLSVGARGSWWQFAVVAAALAAIPFMNRWAPTVDPPCSGVALWHYLPFIFVIQIVSGLMYAYLMPAYHRAALLPGFELLFYIAGVLLSYRIARKSRDLALVCGVMLGMAAFALLFSVPSALRINLSMFAMQAGAGFVDLVIIAVLLVFSNPIRAFGLGMATLCAGILGGKIIAYHFGAYSGAITLAGNLMLNLSIITLYLIGRHQALRHRTAAASAAGTTAAVTPAAAPPAGGPEAPSPLRGFPVADPEPDEEKLPARLRLLLSEREYDVLKRSLAGHTYRKTAQELRISESTVKTYMYRIYEKMDVRNKKELFEKLSA